MMAVASLHDDQRRRAEEMRLQIGTFAAGVGLVGECLPCPGGSDDLIPQAPDVHVGAGDLLPACDSSGGREIEVIGVDGDALRKRSASRSDSVVLPLPQRPSSATRTAGCRARRSAMVEASSSGEIRCMGIPFLYISFGSV